jgi:hypothetical protein
VRVRVKKILGTPLARLGLRSPRVGRPEFFLHPNARRVRIGVAERAGHTLAALVPDPEFDIATAIFLNNGMPS